jgi:hypothetical protein
MDDTIPSTSCVEAIQVGVTLIVCSIQALGTKEKALGKKASGSGADVYAFNFNSKVKSDHSRKHKTERKT